jgi:hypothetical protein
MINDTPDKKVAVVCVLKSGGDYDADYVYKLQNMVKRNTTIPHDFICFSDMELDCKTVKLRDNLPGCWSKVEMFRKGAIEADRVVYFDLDTVILNNIDDILRADHNFLGLRPWNPRNFNRGMFASGMMAWENSRFDYVYRDFREKDIANNPSGDQQYMSNSIIGHGDKFRFMQKYHRGIYSFKRNCRPKKPIDTRIVCFHGKPRPHECSEKWVKENWR